MADNNAARGGMRGGFGTRGGGGDRGDRGGRGGRGDSKYSHLLDN